jgi:hypothetical protein
MGWGPSPGICYGNKDWECYYDDHIGGDLYCVDYDGGECPLYHNDGILVDSVQILHSLGIKAQPQMYCIKSASQRA